MAVGLLTTVAIGLGVGGTVISVLAQRQQTAAAKATAKYNAALAQQKADEERRIGKIKTEVRRKQTRRLLASQLVGFAKGGITPVGTPSSVLTETAKNEALSALYMGREAEISARSYEAKGELFRTQAANIGKAGRLAIGAELIGGIGSTIQTAMIAKSLKKKK